MTDQTSPNPGVPAVTKDISEPRNYHAARWAEPLIFGYDVPGSRGVHVPTLDSALRERLSASGDDRVASDRRIGLPSVSQAQVAGVAQVIGNLVAQDLQRTLDSGARGD